MLDRYCKAEKSHNRIISFLEHIRLYDFCFGFYTPISDKLGPTLIVTLLAQHRQRRPDDH